MVEWWNALTGLERCFAYVAIPATLVLAIQTVLLLIGLGNGDAGTDGISDGVDLDGDGIPDIDVGGMEGIDLDGDGIPDMELDLDPDLPGREISSDGGLRVFTIRGWWLFSPSSAGAALPCCAQAQGRPYPA